MVFNEVKELIELINNSELAYFEMQDESNYIKIDKSMLRSYVNNTDYVESKSVNKLDLTDISDRIEMQKNIDNDIDNNLHSDDTVNEDITEGIEHIKSPIVGTYYEAVSPEAEPFVKVGQKVSKGDVICIVEAMKLMNEISADYDCEIVSIESQNGKMVEYGQSLFKVRRV